MSEFKSEAVEQFEAFMWGITNPQDFEEVRVCPRLYDRMMVLAGRFNSKGYPAFRSVLKWAYDGNLDMPIIRDDKVFSWKLIPKKKELISMTELTNVRINGRLELPDAKLIENPPVIRELGVFGKAEHNAEIETEGDATMKLVFDTLFSVFSDGATFAFDADSKHAPWMHYHGAATIATYDCNGNHRKLYLRFHGMGVTIDESKRPKLKVTVEFEADELQAAAEYMGNTVFVEGTPAYRAWVRMTEAMKGVHIDERV